MAKGIEKLWSKISKGTYMAFLTIFAWEMVEELLENLIAYVISNALALFITKALSTLAIITATQGIKVSIKRFLMPFVKTLSYREGYDKMNLLKKYFARAWGNKVTGALAGAGFAGIAYFQTMFSFATGCWWVALIVGFVFFNVGIYFGGETLDQIKNRLADALLKKEDKEKVKLIEKKAEELAKQDHEHLLERAKALIEEETAKKLAENVNQNN